MLNIAQKKGGFRPLFAWSIYLTQLLKLYDFIPGCDPVYKLLIISIALKTSKKLYVMPQLRIRNSSFKSSYLYRLNSE
jgi:hypothetical protein